MTFPWSVDLGFTVPWSLDCVIFLMRNLLSLFSLVLSIYCIYCSVVFFTRTAFSIVSCSVFTFWKLESYVPRYFGFDLYLSAGFILSFLALWRGGCHSPWKFLATMFPNALGKPGLTSTVFLEVPAFSWSLEFIGSLQPELSDELRKS